MSTLGERLRKSRERKGLTQTEASRRSNINNKTLSRYENDGTKPDPETLKVLAELYDVTTDFLLGLDGNKENKTWVTQDQKAFFRGDFSGLTEEEQDLLKEDMEEYFTHRKAMLLKRKKKK